MIGAADMAGGLSIIERAIGVLSPKWAAQRGYARGVLQDVDAWLGKRAFDAAKRGGRATGWRGVGGSANAEVGPALDIIRKRARDMAQNDGWGAQICAKLPAKIIGTGIVPRAASENKGVRVRARDAWESFVENSDPSGQLDFYGQSFLAAGTTVKSGEALIRWYLRPRDFGLKVPLQCEVLEPDYLDTAKTEETSSGNLILQGVEFDHFGRRVAYWLFPVHPGEVGGVAAMARGNRFQSQRVDATFVDHIYRMDRPGQVRGVSWLAPVLMTMRDIADYEEAELVRKKIAACLSFFIKSKDGSAAGIGQVVREQGEAGKASPRIESVKPGRIHYLQPDEEPFGVDPNQSPSTGYAEYLATQLRKCAAGVGMTYEGLSGDLSKVNYSSIREGKLDFWDTLDALQWNMMIPQHCRPAWRRVMFAASANGLKVATDLRAIWTPPKRPWVDPVKDVNAKIAELAVGLESWPDAIAALGHDPEDRIAEILEWLPRLLSAGIDLSKVKAAAPAPAKPSKPGADDGEDKNDTDDEGEDDDDADE
jgi:lambda family phage portal protein